MTAVVEGERCVMKGKSLRGDGAISTNRKGGYKHNVRGGFRAEIEHSDNDTANMVFSSPFGRFRSGYRPRSMLASVPLSS
jgi:hypothetical protein